MGFLEQIAARGWVFVALLTIIVILSVCAMMRTRRDMRLKPRTTVPRRKAPRHGSDRRWEGQRRKR